MKFLNHPLKSQDRTINDPNFRKSQSSGKVKLDHPRQGGGSRRYQDPKK